MSQPYTVKSGDNLSRIAARHGLKSWRDIYDHPDNAAFRRKRPNPNLIFAGDVVMIPVGGEPLPPSPPLPPLPPPEPEPTPPPPEPTRDEIARDMKAYLGREAKRDVVGILGGHSARLIVFGEIHRTNLPAKSRLLAALVKQVTPRPPLITHFHASEMIANDQPTRDEISAVLKATGPQLQTLSVRLSGELRPFRAVLLEANNFPGKRYGVLPIQFAGNEPEDVRHTALFQSFEVAALVCPDVPLMSINATLSRGNILLGARHAAHKHVAARATKTTCAQLEDAGWTTLSVRLTVHDLRDTPVPESLNVRLLSGTDTREIDLLKIIEDVAGGSNLFVDLRNTGTPFDKVRLSAPDTAAIPFNQLFDAIVHLV